MKISLKWLKQYIDVEASPEEIAERLTMLGLEVESIEDLGSRYRGFVVGQVVSVMKHPNADKLTVCKVNVGKDVVQIVCGAPNVAADQKVAVGLVGAVVPRNQHDPNGARFTLAHVKLRGQDSFGMICSAYELDIGEEREGIVVLDRTARPGTPLADQLGLNDVVFEIGITPNRGDAMSHIGIAREVAVVFGRKLRLPAAKCREAKTPASRYAAVRIEDKTNCPRYSARLVFGVSVAPSPKWLQAFLSAVGIRPVNNIVDVTNYVLMEIGHPLHAFDYDQLKGHSLIIRPAGEGQSFVTLDHKERKLKGDTLMICDGEREIAIAGVMGGENSEITPSTTNILIESAYFRPQSIRRTAKYLGLSTDASQRFERGADPEITLWAVDRAACLIQQVSGGEVLRGSIDRYPRKIPRQEVVLRPKKLNEILGISLNEQKISSLLAKLEIQPAGGTRGKKAAVEKISFLIPSYRRDLEREIDLIEEVARVHGYDKIDTKSEAAIDVPEMMAERDLSAEIRDWLCGSGYREIVTNSMQERDVALLASENIVGIANPISREMAALRTSLIPGMLQVVRTNIFHGSSDLWLFEFGKKYFHEPAGGAHPVDRFVEQGWLMMAYTGRVKPASWDRKSELIDLFDVKGELTTMFKKIFLDKYKFIPYSTTNALTETGLRIEINGETVGYLGLISKPLLRQYEIEQEVYVAELHLDVLKHHLGTARKFQRLPRFPSILRDVALVVDENVPVGTIEQGILEAGRPMLARAELFDIYRGEQIGPGKKSTAYALEFVSEEHTLTQEEIDRVMKSIISRVQSTLKAELRA